MTNKITEDMAGCWFDGHYGWTNSYRVVEVATGYGFTLDADEERLLNVYRLDDVEKAVELLMQERLGNPGQRGEEVAVSMDAVFAEAEALHEAAREAVTGQGGLADRATEHLDSLAPEGMAFHWDDGLALMCLCQIEGTEENMALFKTDKYYCNRCAERYAN
jgi:hypothetical protein